MSRLTKALALTPGVLVSTALTCAIGSVLPGPAGAVLFFGGLACAIALAAGRAEDLAARLLLRGRPLTDVEAAALAPAMTLLCRSGLGPPAVRVCVRDGVRPVAAGAAGRRSVVVSAGLVAAVQDGQLPSDEAAAVMAHAAALIRAGLVRSDLLLGFWTLPWQVVRAVAGAVAGVFGRLPGTSAVWRLRFVVAGIAVVQMTAQGYLPIAVLIAAITALTYATPRWERAWQEQLIRSGDEQVRDIGLARPLARFLRRRRPTTQTRERIFRLEAPPARPALGMVGSRS